ncbi:MAG: DUF1836 domain-containing protein [Eubacteriales bacterium]|nr:DUF1836 domain-containing protein [Eubacteriales bacterium]
MLTFHGDAGLQAYDRIVNYELPAWEQLPESIQSRDFQRFVANEIGWLFPGENLLTGYMLQNYLKWELLPPVVGRKYSREHVAWCLCITLLKQVFELEQVNLGILLQRRLMPVQEAYAVFREQFKEALHFVFEALVLRTHPEAVDYPSEELAFNRLAVGAACRSLAWHLLTRIIMSSGGAERVFSDLADYCSPKLSSTELASLQNCKKTAEPSWRKE